MKILYFAPVEEYYFKRWEYYKVDLDILSEISTEVLVCHSLPEVLRVIRRVDLIYCWWWHRSAPVVLLARLIGRPIITTGAEHMFDLSGAADFYKKSVFYRVASRFSLRSSSASLFISKDQLLQVTTHCKVTNPFLAYSSLSLEMERAAEQRRISSKSNTVQREPKALPHFKFTTLCWHTAEQYLRKGVWETLAALAEPSELYTFEWTIIGADGNGLNELRSRISALGLGELVTVQVDVERSSINETLAATDLYIQPSWYEGFGNAVLEAMIFGTPALVSKYSAQPEVVGSCGFVCMELTKKGIRQSIEKFAALTHSQRLELREKVAKRAHRAFGYSNRLQTIRSVAEQMLTIKK